MERFQNVFKRIFESYVELVKSKKRSLPLEPARGKELLPGIDDDITLGHISAKLPWSDICVMSSVSHRWWQAIQNREVYNARVLENLTDTCIVVVHDASAESIGYFEISLYSTRDKSYQTLPVEPPSARQLATLDGKVYSFQEELKQLCVLDLAAGQRQWKPCGRFRQPFDYHDFGVMDGKIYIFLSTFLRSKLPGPRIFGWEVFDPTENTWPLTKPTQRPPRVGFEVAVVGDEFVVYGGRQHDDSLEPVDFVYFYHPGKDEWRVTNSFNLRDGETLFIVNERFYSMSSKDIHTYDVQGSSWAHLHSLNLTPPEIFSPAPERATLQNMGEVHSADVGPITVVDNELLAPWKWIGPRDSCRSFFIQSIGFASQNKKLVWQKVKFPFFSEQQLPCCIPPRVQLIRL